MTEEYVLTDHVIMRYVQRFWAPGCDEEKARKLAKTRDRWIRKRIQQRLRDGAVYHPESRIAPAKDAIFIQHQGALFVCEPRGGPRLAVVTCFHLDTYIENSRAAFFGAKAIKTDEGLVKAVKRPI